MQKKLHDGTKTRRNSCGKQSTFWGLGKGKRHEGAKKKEKPKGGHMKSDTVKAQTF